MAKNNIQFDQKLCEDCVLAKQFMAQRKAGFDQVVQSVSASMSDELGKFKINDHHLNEKAIATISKRIVSSLVERDDDKQQELDCYKTCFKNTGCVKQKAQILVHESRSVKSHMIKHKDDTAALLLEIQDLVETIIDMSRYIDEPDFKHEDRVFRVRILDRILIDMISEATTALLPERNIDFLKDVIPRPFLETFISVMKELLGNDFINTLKYEIDKALEETNRGRGLTRDGWEGFQDTQVFKDIVAALQTQLAQQAKKESFQEWCHNKLEMVDDVNILILKRVLETLGKSEQVHLF